MRSLERLSMDGEEGALEEWRGLGKVSVQGKAVQGRTTWPYTLTSAAVKSRVTWVTYHDKKKH